MSPLISLLLLLIASPGTSPYVFSIEEDSTEDSIDIFCFIKGTVIGHWWLKDVLDDCNHNSTVQAVPTYNCTVFGNRNMKMDMENTLCLESGTFFDVTWLCGNLFFRRPHRRCKDKQFRCIGVMLRCNTYTWTLTHRFWMVVLAVAIGLLLVVSGFVACYVALYYAHNQSFNVRARGIQIHQQLRQTGEGMEIFTDL